MVAGQRGPGGGSPGRLIGSLPRNRVSGLRDVSGTAPRLCATASHPRHLCGGSADLPGRVQEAGAGGEPGFGEGDSVQLLDSVQLQHQVSSLPSGPCTVKKSFLIFLLRSLTRDRAYVPLLLSLDLLTRLRLRPNVSLTQRSRQRKRELKAQTHVHSSRHPRQGVKRTAPHLALPAGPQCTRAWEDSQVVCRLVKTLKQRQ